MAVNSKRERIITKIAQDLNTVSALKMVQRRKAAYEDLAQFANTQMPLAAIVGKLPSPVQKLSARSQGQVDKFISSLDMDIYVYMLANEDSDTLISSMVDDLWVKLYDDETKGGLTLSTEVLPDLEIGEWDPYVAFKIVCRVTYQHTTGGI